ncbi:MAG: transposase [Okeania sp. SIO1H4]|nr:transposase [Okeania sp. SIO1H4]NET79382.1 transposase [Okeania sp. SIO1F9]RQH21825.1 transposase [Okeania hirsuta]
MGISHRETVEQIKENPYLQYFIGQKILIKNRRNKLTWMKDCGTILRVNSGKQKEDLVWRK